VQLKNSITPKVTNSPHTQLGGLDKQLPVRWLIRQEPFVFLFTWLKLLTNLHVYKDKCCRILGREPTPEELAKELDMSPEKVVEVQKYGREPISLHTPLGEDGDSEFGDLIEDSEAIVPSDAVSFTLLQEQLDSVLDTLSERERGVVRMRFGLTDGQPKTLDEIGQVYGVTRERIRQIESKTMSKLRHPSRSQVLRDYLD